MSRSRAFWMLLALAAVVPAGRLVAQESVDPRWLPWLGCWQPVEDVVAGFGDDAEARQAYFCVRPGVGGVEIATVVDDAPVSSRSMVADGARHEVSEDGCSGWQTAEWSADGRRLFVASEVLCEGGVTRSASGLMAMVSPTEWIDAHAMGLGDERVPRAVRYRPAPTSVAETAGFDLRSLRFGVVADARRMAAAPLSIEDVAEASDQVDGLALEVFLFERGQGFELEADRIASLADQGVSEDVIDLMVALSYPNKFSLNRQAMSGEFLPDPERPVSDRYASGYYGRDRYRDYCYGSGFYYSYCSPYGYMPLGWSYGYYNPYMYGGYGYGYGGFGYGGGYGRPIIVVDQGDRSPSPGGRAVKGQGYTRSRGTASGGSSSAGGSRTGASSVGRSGGSSGGSSAGSSAGTSSGGSSSSGRTAKRRGGGGL